MAESIICTLLVPDKGIRNREIQGVSPSPSIRKPPFRFCAVESRGGSRKSGGMSNHLPGKKSRRFPDFFRRLKQINR